jgi:hypothetical protein
LGFKLKRCIFAEISVYEKNGWFMGARRFLQLQFNEELFPMFYLYAVSAANG